MIPISQREMDQIYKTEVEENWMLSYAKTEEERKMILQTLEENFRLEYPDYNPELIPQEIEEENKRIFEKRIQKYQHFIDTNYHEGLYAKIATIIDSYGSVSDNTYYYSTDRNQRFYCCKHGFLDYLYDHKHFPLPYPGDIVILRNGSSTPICVVIKKSPIVTLYNLKNSLEETPNEFLYGVVLTGPENIMSPHIETRVIFQIKNIASIEGQMPCTPRSA